MQKKDDNGDTIMVAVFMIIVIAGIFLLFGDKMRSCWNSNQASDKSLIYEQQSTDDYLYDQEREREGKYSDIDPLELQD